jgi:glyoxylase-like metal-dependent hydrolase (beta-lactamase superfamily II)
VTAPLVRTVPVGPLQCNCSIVADPEAGEAVIIDPGDEPEKILRVLAATKCRAVALLHTHGHFDHIGGTAGVRRSTGAAIRIHAADRPLYDALPEQAGLFGLSAEPPLPPDGGFTDGESIPFGRYSLSVIHTPGHTPGSSCFRLEAESPVLFSGDTLFRRSIGRTDLRGGDTAAILNSIRSKLFTLPPELRVVCGHGPDTTIGAERKSNPFVNS